MALNETIDAGTQTIVHEEPPKTSLLDVDFTDGDTDRNLLSYKHHERNSKTHVGTPKGIDGLETSSSKKRSIVGGRKKKQS